MKHLHSSTQIVRKAIFLAGSMSLMTAALTGGFPLATPLVAQDQARVVQGKVTDKSDAGLKGATVYLKDGHTLSVRSYISADDGSYRFGQLVQNTDYQIWAESDGHKSGVKNISSFDNRNQINLNLKIDK